MARIWSRLCNDAFETVPLFEDELVAILPGSVDPLPKKVTPAFLSRQPLILGNEASALRRDVETWLAPSGARLKPLMEFDNVEAIKSLVAVGLGASIVPSLSLGAGHLPARNMHVVPLSPRVTRRVALVQTRGKRKTEGVRLVIEALLTLRQAGAAK